MQQSWQFKSSILESGNERQTDSMTKEGSQERLIFEELTANHYPQAILFLQQAP